MIQTKPGEREFNGFALAWQRRRVGLTGRRLAILSSISPQYLSMIEVGDRSPTPAVIRRLAKSLDLDPRVLATPSELN